jgi:hypothetical protein
VTNLDSTPQLKNFDLDAMPIVLPQDQKPIVLLVDKIMALKATNYNIDTESLENKIDQLVYQLYELTPEEIAVVEGKANIKE